MGRRAPAGSSAAGCSPAVTFMPLFAPCFPAWTAPKVHIRCSVQGSPLAEGPRGRQATLTDASPQKQPSRPLVPYGGGCCLKEPQGHYCEMTEWSGGGNNIMAARRTEVHCHYETGGAGRELL